MITSLSGKFVDFKATFTHADELGGALTSLIQATNTHFLIHDVRVDLPGRDQIRDFLALDGNAIRVYESDLLDSLVTDQSGASSFAAGTNGVYALNAPATAGFMYVSLPDPFNGAKAMGRVVRSDGKVLAAENTWFSKTRNADKTTWNYRVNFFDVNHPGGAYQVAVTDIKQRSETTGMASHCRQNRQGRPTSLLHRPSFRCRRHHPQTRGGTAAQRC